MTSPRDFWSATAAGARRSWPPEPLAAGEDGPAWLTYIPAGMRDLVKSHLPSGMAGAAFPSPFAAPSPPSSSSDGARFLSASFTNDAGTRPYRLYVPANYSGAPVPLVVMLHGCSQSPEDFAAGTGMNDAAERLGCLVAYPGQTSQAHRQKCWKWFSADDQQRGRGEPSLIAGITRQVMQDYAVDPRRVFVAGLSAGGAAAAIMGAVYPDLYAAIGVHSGLACGAARDLPSALAAMKRGGAGTRAPQGGRIVPAIVFHGERDTTVSPLNGDDVIVQSIGGAGLRRVVETRAAQSGRDCTRTTYADGQGHVVTERWLIHGAGHAWSGGRAAGSYTDPLGPDATGEMLRFFGEHPLPPSPAAAR